MTPSFTAGERRPQRWAGPVSTQTSPVTTPTTTVAAASTPQEQRRQQLDALVPGQGEQLLACARDNRIDFPDQMDAQACERLIRFGKPVWDILKAQAGGGQHTIHLPDAIGQSPMLGTMADPMGVASVSHLEIPMGPYDTQRNGNHEINLRRFDDGQHNLIVTVRHTAFEGKLRIVIGPLMQVVWPPSLNGRIELLRLAPQTARQQPPEARRVVGRAAQSDSSLYDASSDDDEADAGRPENRRLPLSAYLQNQTRGMLLALHGSRRPARERAEAMGELMRATGLDRHQADAMGVEVGQLLRLRGGDPDPVLLSFQLIDLYRNAELTPQAREREINKLGVSFGEIFTMLAFSLEPQSNALAGQLAAAARHADPELASFLDRVLPSVFQAPAAARIEAPRAPLAVVVHAPQTTTLAQAAANEAAVSSDSDEEAAPPDPDEEAALAQAIAMSLASNPDANDPAPH